MVDHNISVITADLLQEILRERLEISHIHIEDESHLHAGHAGSTGGSHFRVAIASPQFEGLMMIKQHRLVYDALAAEMKTSIHALALKTYTPEQWPL